MFGFKDRYTIASECFPFRNEVNLMVVAPKWKELILSHLNKILHGIVSNLDAIGQFFGELEWRGMKEDMDDWSMEDMMDEIDDAF